MLANLEAETVTMGEVERAELAGHRIVVVDLDPGWRFVDHVRALALDLLDRALDGTIAFRTLHGQAQPGTAIYGRDRIWGAFWPRLYEGDRTSLIAELIDTLDGLDRGAGRSLDVCAVIPMPANRAREEGPDYYRRALEIWQEFLEALTAKRLEVEVGRFAFVRESQRLDPGEEARRYDDIAALSRPPETGGDAPFNRVIVLRRVAGQTEPPYADEKQFLILRALLEMLEAAREDRAAPDGASRIGDFIIRRKSVDIVDFASAEPPCSVSERLAAFMAMYDDINKGKNIEGQSNPEGINKFLKDLSVILEKIAQATADRTFEASMPPDASAGVSRARPLQYEILRERYQQDIWNLKGTFWSPTLGRQLKEKTDALETGLVEWWRDEMKGVYGTDVSGKHDAAERRLTLVRTVNGMRFNVLSNDLKRLTLDVASLSAEDEARIDGFLKTVSVLRESLLSKIEKSREQFVFSGDDPDPNWRDGQPYAVTLSCFDQYHNLVRAQKEVISALETLIPLRYLLGAGLFVAFGSVTVAAYSYGDAQARALPLWDWWFEWERPIIPVLWAVTVALMIGHIAIETVFRRHNFRVKCKALVKNADALIDSIRGWVDAVRRYSNDILHVRFYEKVIDEIESRRDTADRRRFETALGEINLDGSRLTIAAPTWPQAQKLLQTTHEHAASTVMPGWFHHVLPHLRDDAGRVPGTQIVVYSRLHGARSDDARYCAHGTSFVADVTLRATEMAAVS